MFARTCQQVKIMFHHNNYPKDIVYDLNAYSEEILTLEKYKFSSNIGSAMKTLSALEFNFGRKTKVAGFLLNVGNRNVTWSIMKKPQVPRLCANDADCVASSTSIGGFIVLIIPVQHCRTEARRRDSRFGAGYLFRFPDLWLSSSFS